MKSPGIPASRHLVVPALLGLLLAGCASNGFTSDLKVGEGADQKDVLLSRVKAAREDQISSQASFVSAFTLYSQLVNPAEGDIEDLYAEFQEEVDGCAEQVADLAERIEGLQTCANLLFEGWQTELDQFASPRMRAKSEAMLIDTQKRFERLMTQLGGTYTKMDEVLVGYRDYILFFNHNLNARALSTLEDENARFVADVRELKDQITKARSEADAFIQALEGPTGILPKVEAEPTGNGQEK